MTSAFAQARAASTVPSKPVANTSAVPPALSSAFTATKGPTAALTSSEQNGALESLVGRNLLAWAGVGLLFLCMAFFVKYAYDQAWFGQLIGPRTRVLLVAGAGMGLAAWGWQWVRQGMAALGHSAVGGGLAIVQIAVYAAVIPALALAPEPLISHGVAFFLLVVITAAGVLSARHLDALTVSLIAVIGGLLAPVLLSTGENGRDLLFMWLLVLDLGVLAVAIEKRWRALDVVAGLGTGILAWGWFGRHYSPDQLLPTMLWFSAFHAVFLALPLLFHVRTKTPVTIERVTLLLGNLAWFLGITGELSGVHAARFIGIESAILAPLYLGIGCALQRRIPTDTFILPTSIALAIGLVTMALGNLLPVNGVAVAWAVEAAVLLHLGYQYRHELTRIAALLLTGLVAMQVLHHVPAFDAEALPFMNFQCLQLALAGLTFGLQAVIHRYYGFRASAVDHLCARLCGLAAVVWMMVLGQVELVRHLDDPLLPSALWWLLGGSLQLVIGRWLGGWPVAAMPWCAGLCGLIAGGEALAAYGVTASIPLSGSMVFNLRWIAAMGAVALLVQTRKPAVRPLAWIVGFLAWSFEGPAWCQIWFADPAEATRAGSFALTAAWMLAAGILLTGGLLRGNRSLRVMALLLCALVAGKLLLVDLAQANQLWRILAFGLVGVLFLAGSWAYHRLLRPTLAAALEKQPTDSSDRSDHQ